MQDKIKIQKISKADYESWHSLWQSYLEFYKTELSDEIYLSTFNRLIDEQEKRCEGFLAFYDGKPAGLVHYLTHLHLWQEKETCYLQDLFVAENFRSKGIAKQLMLSVYQRADELGLQGVYWTTQDFNTNARLLYDKIGKLSPFIKYHR